MATHDVNARRFFDREGPFSEQGRETERSANTLPAVPVALHWDDVARSAEAEERRAMPCSLQISSLACSVAAHATAVSI